jgi:polyhydroxyalkanoate synthesis repressor PhaR
MSESVRIVKKYQNRKLYDTQDSCYVTLDGIAKMIRRGEEIVVIDNNSKNDVTALILTQVLYEQEKTNQSVLPVPILKNIIKSGSNNLFEFMQKYVLGALDAQVKAQKDMSKHIERLVKAGDLTSNEGETLINQLNEALEAHKDQLDQKIEARIVEKFNQTPELQTEFQMMSTRVASLENRVQ